MTAWLYADARVRGFAEGILKLAKTRWQVEAEKDPSLRRALAGAADPSDVGAIRQQLAAPAERSASSLALKRQLAEKLYAAQTSPAVKHPGVMAIQKSMAPGAGPATMANVGMVFAPKSSGRFMEMAAEASPKVLGMKVPKHLQVVGATLSDLPGVTGALGRKALGEAKSPATPTMTHAVLRHELGEAAAAAEPTIRPFSSHIGVRPILEENIAMLGDPQAVKKMQQLRALHSDDALVQKLIRQAGGTPDAPLAIGGKQQKALGRMLDRASSKLQPSTRLRALQMGLVLDKPVGYIPKGVQPTAGEIQSTIEELGQAAKGKDWRGALKTLKGAGRRIGEMRRFVKG